MILDYFQAVLSPRIWLRLAHAGFVAPFRNARLGKIYASCLTYGFGIAAIDLFSLLEVADLGQREVIELTLWKLVSASLFIVLMMLVMHSWPGRTKIVGMLLYLPASLLLIIQPGGPELWLIGLYFGAAAGSYWSVYHLLMLRHSTDENQGNEIGLGLSGMSIGVFSGLIMAGMLKQFNIPPSIMMLLAVGTVSMSIILLYTYRPHAMQHLADTSGKGESMWKAIRKDPYRTLMTIIEGVADIPRSTAWPVWMASMGLAAMAIGAVQAISIVVVVFLSPLFGHWANRRSGEELNGGLMLQTLSWIPVLLSATPITVALAAFVRSIGMHAVSLGMARRWYNCRSLKGMAARELLLGTGRVLGIGIFIPLVYATPEDFLWAGAALGLLTTVGSWIWLRRLRLPMNSCAPVILEPMPVVIEDHQ